MDKLKSLWLHGLLAALIGGFASAMDSGIAILIIAPTEFNLGPKFGHTLLTITILAALSGAKLAFAYLKSAPVPDSREVWTDDQRALMLGGKVDDGKTDGQAKGKAAGE